MMEILTSVIKEIKKPYLLKDTRKEKLNVPNSF
jgi:hypothetical protein